jgi:2-oxoglutarate ferredoxin oxidoreductase subunit alpha
MGDKQAVIVLAGEAGQGIQSIESMLVGILKKDGFNVFATKEYMSRVRGGVNSTEIIISEDQARAFREKIDLFIPLNEGSVDRLKGRISGETAILGDSTQVKHEKLINVPFQRIASEFGNVIFSNTVAVGTICGILDVNEEMLYAEVKSKFIAKGDEIADKNLKAVSSGYAIGRELKNNGIIKISLKKKSSIEAHLLLSGADAIALGALSGGCDACFAYPMTPGSSVFTAMAFLEHKAGIAVEQAEDEICAMNMALGASYAGASSMVSTSGGGFALMVEGLSLAGMIETPVVVHLAQRPGPATGLPTRSQQGDLNLALYSGHGFFPRAIYAPGTVKEGFELSALAFETADKFQSPVFILSDQYFVDSYYNMPISEFHEIKYEKHIIETKPGYKRYQLSLDGISPRGVPGFGSGFVCADSDEHDEAGRITEDLDGVRNSMVEKRMKKAALIKKAALEPVITGPKDYSRLIVSWGSNFNAIEEALSIVNDPKTAFVHFPQVYPLHKRTSEILSQAKEIIDIEQNETGQFADLIKLETGIDIKKRILKYNGMPFSVEEIVKVLK